MIRQGRLSVHCNLFSSSIWTRVGEEQNMFDSIVLCANVLYYK